MIARRAVKKCIEPYSAFVNGRKTMATAINVQSVYDDLFDHAVLKYTLYDATGSWAGEASCELHGDAYHAWDSTPEHAFTIVAELIGVTFVPMVGGRGFFGMEIE